MALTIGPTRFGIDVRRKPSSSIPGTFREMKDVVVSNGGEIEKRKAWVKVANAAGTVGMAVLAGQLFTFGSGARPSTLPANVGYMRLQNAGATLTRIVSVARYDGRPYVVARFSDGKDIHFYDGVPVDHWVQTNGYPIETVGGVADYIATIVDAHPNFRAIATANQIDVWGASDFSFDGQVLGATVSGVAITEEVVVPFKAEEPQAPAEAFLRIRAQAGQTLTSLNIEGLELIEGTITAAAGYAATAQRIATAIAAYAPWLTPSVETLPDGVYVKLLATPGNQWQGKSLSWKGTMQLDGLSFTGASDPSPLVEKQVRFTISGDYDPGAVYQLVLAGDAFSKGEFARNQCDFLRPFGRKLWAVFDDRLAFSAIDHPTLWDPDNEPVEQTPGGETINPVGAGFLRVSSYSAEAHTVKAIVPYATSLLAVCEGALAFINSDPDPDLTGVGDIIETAGTRFPLSVRQQGARDVLYMSAAGVRSVRAQASYDAPFVSDVGAPIDTLVRPLLRQIGRNAEDTVVNAPDPDGRAVFFVGNQAFVLSYFPETQIAAWSRWTLPGVVSHAAWTAGSERLWIRCGNDIYLYGGRDGQTYDSTVAVVQSSYLRAGAVDAPASFTKLELDLEGVWRIDVLTNPRDEGVFIRMGEYSEASGHDGRMGLSTKQQWVSVRLASTGSGPRVLSALALS